MAEDGPNILRNEMRSKMERFYNDDEDEKNPFFDPEDDDDKEENLVGYIDQESILEVMQMDLAEAQMDQELLNKAIHIAEKNWLWIFKNQTQKMDEISIVYKKLIEITDKTPMPKKEDKNDAHDVI